MNEPDRRLWPFKPRTTFVAAIVLWGVLLLMFATLRATEGWPGVLIGVFLLGVLPVLLALVYVFIERGGVIETGADTYSVSGKVASPDRAGVGGLRVQIVGKKVGPDVRLAETTTDSRGNYQIGFSGTLLKQLGKVQPDLQARVYSGETFLAASEIRYYAASRETLNVRLPANSEALASEHETLIKALSLHYTGKLADLEETDEHPHITYLANKTGWDARAVALAALADRFSQIRPDQAGAAGISTALYYALFRAGLPANPDTLYRTDTGTVERIWKQAITQGVIPRALEKDLAGSLQAFRQLSAQKILSSPALVGASSMKEMLNASRLDEVQQQKFAELYTMNRADIPKFWETVTAAFGSDTANRLQVDGKLSFLTINNAPLVQSLHLKVGGDKGLSDPLQLAQAGYHRSAKWDELLTADTPIPNEIPGDNAEAKKANYGKYLAAQVRLSYPTAAVAELVVSGDLAVALPEQVHDFLAEHQGKFEIGTQPVQQYIAQNKLEVATEVVTQVQRLQRVYQITPNDEAMTGMMKRGLDAAYHVVRYEKAAFVQTYQQELGGEESAAQTYDKSVQVHNAVLNIAISYLTARTAPGIGVHDAKAVAGEGAQIVDPTPTAANAGDVIAYPTLETLFGEMDFCACDHCRSILSPAAYLVDLLLFIDQPVHPVGTENPQTVLLERRPDVQHLPLTCENTNTALPYIDVVNETLEYFIDKQKLSLEGYNGHDTDGAASEDLLASPQFVMDSAYTALRGERFPAPLPFHQPLEYVRRYFDKFGVPLPLAMERLGKNNDLDRGANPYGWRDILMEEIGLSRAEYEILTDSNAVPLWRMYGFPNGTTDTVVITTLSNAKLFTRRVGITYEDIVSILKTRFVNPNSDLIPKLERLGVPFAALEALKDGKITDAAFDALLPAGAGALDSAEYGGDIRAWVKNADNHARIMGLITLADTTDKPDPCNFDHLEFRYAKTMTAVGDTSTPIGTVEFVRLLRFIRLWKRLGWTIEQTDAAICAAFPVPPFPLAADAIDTVAKLDAGFRTLLLRLGFVVRVINTLNLTPKRDLLPLLACWSEIGTHGDSALYRQMFLNPVLLKQDAVFADNGYGTFLQQMPPKVEVAYTHSGATLEGGITAVSGNIAYDNANHRLSFAGNLDSATRNGLKSAADATLTGTVLASFKRAVDDLYAIQHLLSHSEALRAAFQMNDAEFTLITAALVFDADTLLTLANISAIYRRGWLARKLKISVREFLLLTRLTGLDPFVAPDVTNPAILQIVSLAQALKDGAFKSAAVLYLIWNQDLSGKSAPDLAQVTELARILRGDFASIEDEFSVTEDPGGDIARARMTLVYGQEAAESFFAVLDDTIVLDVAYTHPVSTLEGAITAADSKIAYDHFRHRLSHTGVLTAAMRNALKGVPNVSNEFKTAVAALFDRGEQIKGLFFTRYPELKKPYDDASATPPADRHSAFLTKFQPELSRRRKCQQALQRLSTAAAVDLEFTQALLDATAKPYPLHAAGDTNKPALNDVLTLETPGLAAQYFFRDTATGNLDLSVPTAANLDYASGGSNSLPNPGNAISGTWRGSVETSEAGFYNFVIEADTDATVTLKLDGQVRPLTKNGNIRRNTDLLELKAGTLYEIVLTVEKLKDTLRIKWETPKCPREVIPARYLYPPTILAPFSDAYIRFLKVASLAASLGLTAKEMGHFGTHSDYQIAGDGWLNALPVTGTPDTLTAVALFKPLRDLLDYARIKAAISPDDESLLTALRDPFAKTVNGDSLLFTLTRWDAPSLNDVLAQFGGNIADLKHLELFRRVYDAFALIQTMGISANALIKATTNEPDGDRVRGLQAALRARYDAADWRDVVQPINDAMRGLQRDALVAYILHQMRSKPATEHIDTADKLFEYFLMDVQMEPCMQTSRIRHALSSVQLFIERCLMNLEPRVSPASINAKQWEWMKRYRVWEANRKVFLFPENWLEPELRDDKSPFFKEIESELLQSDITEDSATTALLNYLSKLEEVAKLEPCGIYHAESNEGEIDHVIARTAGANRKYYYRRYDGSWTPWEQIKLDIEDNPVIPVVWNGRLLLFWLRILKQTPDAAMQMPAGAKLDVGMEISSLIPPEAMKVSVRAVLCWSEYYNGKWQPAKTSDVNRPTELGQFQPNAFDRSALCLSVSEAGNILNVDISGQGHAWFTLYNTHSLPVRKEDRILPKSFLIGPTRLIGPSRNLNTSTETFTITYNRDMVVQNPDGTWPAFTLLRPVLKNLIPGHTIEPRHYLNNPWDAPFFYEDGRHVFFVTTTGQQVWIPGYTGYYIGLNLYTGIVGELPVLVIETDPQTEVGPNFWGDGGLVGSDLGVIDTAPIERFISEDAYIRLGIGTTGSVIYGDKQIGPSGAIADALAKMNR